MILTELTSIPSGSLPFYSLKNHLRMGTGFGEDNLQDPLIEAYLRAAISTIEARLGVVLLTRNFSWNLTAWRSGQYQCLPVRPVNSIADITVFDKSGGHSLVDSGAYALIKDGQTPRVVPTGVGLPQVPTGGAVEISFEAGFGAMWEDLPHDLAHAVILLAAHFYENRTGALEPSGVMPMAVLALIEPHRSMRLSGGRGHGG
ncbi:hypothetical protein GCM10007939_03360 [Amylibacter marinus]|uniref:Phage gp6-like head-tail connector protein n=1 Tax=Amylibacter marinus TaxID=1475483 RepID=A0ABQ5VS66_9RHOB|nr:hypothetical protein [Amylibacter marinus]GLQ34053.1 hypothetical protein GCM10007939_03360 [Amylibacter marinus]